MRSRPPSRTVPNPANSAPPRNALPLALSAAIKSGKTSFFGAMIGAATGGPESEADFLGVTAAANPEGLALVHVDTEQSRYDHYAIVTTALRRAGLETPPPWLHSYCFTGLSAMNCRWLFEEALKQAKAKHCGIFAAFIDGVADLVEDVNNPGETDPFVARLHGLAMDFDCPILAGIHLNPGTAKTRGHLGSQLERKAETNLRLEKEGEIVSLWSDRNRRAPIPKNHGPRFIWNSDLGMHVSTTPAAQAKLEAKRPELHSLAALVFKRKGRPSLEWTTFIEALEKMERCSTSSARRKMGDMLATSSIRRDSTTGLYVLGTTP